ncbi:MAG: sugar phosphate isomerase/epimerase, partial [Candidatus Methylomirabilis sp.]|nr:sugar phosphate isomerase/epimerase [Deltaproteobacteria bacterium]
YKGTLDMTAEMGGELMIVHLGNLNPGWEEAREMVWHLAVDALGEVCRHAEERGLLVCLENVGFEPLSLDKTPEDLLRAKEEVASPALRFTIDIMHARLANQLPRIFDLLGEDIRHCHFHDNKGAADDHMGVGRGNYDYPPWMMDWFRRYEHIMTLELVNMSPTGNELLRARERTLRLFDQPSAA